MTHYLDTTNCIYRLYQEYKKHHRLVIACDFDDTLFDFHKNGSDFSEIINIIHRCQKHNFYIVCWTASAPERYDFIKNHAESLGIKFDSFNENPIPLPFGNHKKIYYNHLLDDRAGLSSALTILQDLIDLIEMTSCEGSLP